MSSYNKIIINRLLFLFLDHFLISKQIVVEWKHVVIYNDDLKICFIIKTLDLQHNLDILDYNQIKSLYIIGSENLNNVKYRERFGVVY